MYGICIVHKFSSTQVQRHINITIMNENFFLVFVWSPILLTLMDLKVKVTEIVVIAVAVMMKILKYGMRMWMIF